MSGGVPNLGPLATGAACSSGRFGRRASLADACIARQNNTCPITGRTVELLQLETVHLIPHSIAALETTDDLPYWHLPRSGHERPYFQPCRWLQLLPLDERRRLCTEAYLTMGSSGSSLTSLMVSASYDVEFKWRVSSVLSRPPFLTTNSPTPPSPTTTRDGAHPHPCLSFYT